MEIIVIPKQHAPILREVILVLVKMDILGMALIVLVIAILAFISFILFLIFQIKTNLITFT